MKTLLLLSEYGEFAEAYYVYAYNKINSTYNYSNSFVRSFKFL